MMVASSSKTENHGVVASRRIPNPTRALIARERALLDATVDDGGCKVNSISHMTPADRYLVTQLTHDPALSIMTPNLLKGRAVYSLISVLQSRGVLSGLGVLAAMVAFELGLRI